MASGVDLKITPAGHVSLSDTGEPLKSDDGVRGAFAAGAYGGMLWLVGEGLGASVAPGLAFLRELARRYLTLLCTATELNAPVVPPPGEDLAFVALRCPPIVGAEYVSAGVLDAWWRGLDEHARARAAEKGLKEFLVSLNPAWHALGRVTFHLAENKRDPEYPFAFLATYTHGVSAGGRTQHTPLRRAVEASVDQKDRAALLNLLKPVTDAAQTSTLVKELTESGDVYQSLLWTPADAYRFLQDVPKFEAAGLGVRVPDWWRGRRSANRPKVSVTVGQAKAKGTLGLDALMDFNVAMTLNGSALSEQELAQLLNASEPLVQLRGNWVEIDKDQLQQVLAHWRKVEHLASKGVDFATGMRLLAGVPSASADAQTQQQEQLDAQWVGIQPGQWLNDTLSRLREPAALEPPAGLRATLRPYQQRGFAWLRFMSELRLGACLADDMGLGKTVQVIALLLHLQQSQHGQAPPSLLVVPASLVPNWKSELEKFAPSLRVKIVHPSEGVLTGAAAAFSDGETDVVITTYGMVTRLDTLREKQWTLAVLDEAQAIKNAGTKQSRAVRELRSVARIALSGTPIENRLGDLWSLFEFLNPGLLGSAKSFGKLCKKLAEDEAGAGFAPLRALVMPYVLRRLKTDKTVISDLPDKTELKAYCTLTPRQAALYQQSVEEMSRVLSEAVGDMQRRGLVLAFLMRFKQICNHPAQVLGAGTSYDPNDSGKFERLRELCTELAERQQRVLVFTQFREMTVPLAEELTRVFGREGLVLSGSTSVPQRKKMVDDFQKEDGPPFFVLSLKAGGTGLNLTAASNVIHFDRWWNPAVENQATDRAFRIGQKKNVLVHKFVCRGTIEEKIDEMISGKLELAGQLLGTDGAEKMLTEMNDHELLNFVALDARKATGAE